MIYLILFLIAIPSPLMVIAEPLAVLCGLSAGNDYWWLAALVITSGQTAGFVLLYFFGDQVLVRLSWLKRKFEAFELQKHQRLKSRVTFVAAVLGLPPLNLLSIAGPLYEPRFALMLATIFIGRLTRFLVLTGMPTYFAEYFDPNFLPPWIHELF